MEVCYSSTKEKDCWNVTKKIDGIVDWVVACESKDEADNLIKESEENDEENLKEFNVKLNHQQIEFIKEQLKSYAWGYASREDKRLHTQITDIFDEIA